MAADVVVVQLQQTAPPGSLEMRAGWAVALWLPCGLTGASGRNGKPAGQKV